MDTRPTADVVDCSEVAEAPMAAFTDARARGAGSDGAKSSPVGYLPFTRTGITVKAAHPSPVFGSPPHGGHPVSA
ncbi:MAG: hypothetical protein M0027_03930 [Candidatus Dormibacteraeota bacterium]|nr:hypothetical protein [Candidatus Dormibacteraeota bacterium]